MLVTQAYMTLWDPPDSSPPGFFVHGILQARILEWVASFFSWGSSRPRDQTQIYCIVGFFTDWVSREASAWIFQPLQIFLVITHCLSPSIHLSVSQKSASLLLHLIWLEKCIIKTYFLSSNKNLHITFKTKSFNFLLFPYYTNVKLTST